MEKILADYKKFKAYNEAYEVVKTIEVVGYDRQFYRIEVLKCYSNSNTPYVVRYLTQDDYTVQPTYPYISGKFTREPESVGIWKHIDLPDEHAQNAEDALRHAVWNLAERARIPKDF